MKNYKVKVVLDPPGVAKEGIDREGPLTPEHVSQLGPRFNAMLEEAQDMPEDTKVSIEVELSDEDGTVTSTLAAETTKGDILVVKTVLDSINQMVAADNTPPSAPDSEEPTWGNPIEAPVSDVGSDEPTSPAEEPAATAPEEPIQAPEGDEQTAKA